MDLSGLGTDPIPGDNPAGRDIRLEDGFFQIQAEIDRLNSLSLAEEGGVKWPRVAELTRGILKDESKDLLIAVYLGVSLMESEGIPSLPDSFRMLHDLIGNFWDALYPPLKRLRARVNAIDWWREKTAAYLKKYSGPPQDPSVIKRAQEEAVNLGEELSAKKLPSASDIPKLLSVIPVAAAQAEAAPAGQAPPEPPAPGAVASGTPAAVEAADSGEPQAAPGAQAQAAQAQAAQAQAAQAQAAPAPAAQEAPAPRQAPAAAPAGPPPEDLPEARERLIQALDSCLGLMGRVFEEPRWWQLSRLRLWLPVEKVPPASGGRTMIPAPPPEVMGSLRALMDKGDFREALSECENAVPGYLFWMDLHHLSAQALLALKLPGCAQALKHSSAMLLARLPEIQALAFEDGTPFLSTGAREWLAEGGGGASATHPSLVNYRALSEGDPQAAIQSLSLPEFAPKNGRDRVEKAICEIVLWQRLERPRTAAGAAEELEGLFKKHALAEFDPDLAARAAKTMYNVYRALGPDFKGKTRDSLNLLARLSPSEALSLPPPEDE